MLSCGEHDSAACRVSDVRYSPSGTSFTLTTPDGHSADFKTALLGRANLQDLALAIGTAYKMGVTLEQMRPAVRRLKPVEHRLQLKTGGAYTIIDDAYNSNPQGAAVALDTLSGFDGVRVLLTPGLVELGERQHECNVQLGERAANCCDYAVLVGKKQAVPIFQGLANAGFDQSKIAIFDDVRDALSFAATLPGGQGKTVLLLNDLPDK